jgi:hypothetical protein
VVPLSADGLPVTTALARMLLPARRWLTQGISCPDHMA